MQQIILSKEEYQLLFDSRDNSWYIKEKDSNVENNLSLNKNLTGFLKVLYEDPQVVYSSIIEFSKKNDLDSKVLDSFPIKSCIIFCIKNDMIFWLDLSSKWIEYFPVDVELKGAIESVIKNTKITQALRHKLLKAINRK